ncbi:5'-methylthioadenosine/S-adenosylhomocysteine nucleosidase [Brachybacterium hainanense]|uniref:adenosylhomocysteine nucleosidase n=1 Tax=Brachybacterium hainanense TaxID=1541174 RepID=A0ABV6RHE4_9MICO
MSPGSHAADPAASPVLILAAMPEEAAPLRARLREAEELAVPFVRAVSAVRGLLEGRPAVVVTTGIGMAAASAATTWAILVSSPRLVISAGSCGGLAADVEVGTLVIGEAATGSIADATAFGYAPGQVPGDPERYLVDPELVAAATAAAGGSPVRTGLMLSGDAFVTADLAAPMRERFPGAVSADMETTAIARTADVLGVPFIPLRAISDLCGPAAGQQFHLELEVVAETSAAAVAALVAALPAEPSIR